MKTRKVNKVGRDTLTLSLPREWVFQNNIQKGMELEVEEVNDKLVINSGNIRKKEITIEVNNISTFLLGKWINDSYIQNVDKLTINLSKKYIFNHEINKEVPVADYVTNLIRAYIGFEIISQNEKKILIQNLIKENDTKNFTIIQKRTHLLFVELVNQICENINKKPVKFESGIKTQILNVRKFIYYCTRLIINSNIDVVSKIKWYVLYDHLDNSLYNIEKIINYSKEISEISRSVKSAINDIFFLFAGYLKLEDVDNESINKLVMERYKLLSKISHIKTNSSEEIILRELRIFTNIHHDFILAYIHLQPN